MCVSFISAVSVYRHLFTLLIFYTGKPKSKILLHIRFKTRWSICCVSSLSFLSALEAYANSVSIWICISKQSARDHGHA